MTRHRFPEGFLWGVATSAQQIEGARRDDGRGDSIWDRFAETPGKIADGSDPGVACDHYHRWREDVDLMQRMGLNAYRFSIAWPRVLPEGRGTVNAAGLGFYDALIDALLEAGLEPLPTLYHWDLPQALQDRGGWSSRDTVDAFAEYATAVARRLGDRVRWWTTHNEPWCVATLGHEEGPHAPGHTDPAEALRVAHHLLLSHARASAAIRGNVSGAEVGVVTNYCPAHPATDGEADRDAARWFDGFFNRWYLDPLFRGEYPADAVADRIAAGHLAGPELPFVRDGDLAAISQPLSFLGINYYSRVVMRAGADGRREAVPPAPPAAVTDMGWEVRPECLHESLLRLVRDYAPRRLLITENGAAYDDPPGPDGRIADARRIDYLRGHLLAAQRAIADGVPLQGYFAWSLLDNFEWSFGYRMKFGLHAIDPLTLARLPKDSAGWYADVVSANAVEDTFPSTG
ncbi:MAG: beta-glucosidase [bacterium]|nr:beta-glucosidase [bacterium]